jgi:hypothetical protein
VVREGGASGGRRAPSSILAGGSLWSPRKGGEGGAGAGWEPGDAAKSGSAVLTEHRELGKDQRLAPGRTRVAAAANRCQSAAAVL